MIDRILLFPYYLVLKIRNSYYDKGGRRVHPADVPTLCVGNITAGGTGKTPHVEMIVRLLLESDEWGCKNIAVLSRGYKRESSCFQQVTREGSAAMFGDEPLQIKKKFPGITVAVDKNRLEGCDLLCHPDKLSAKRFAKKIWDRTFPAADYIVLDDAFQYRKLKATGNILLMDYSRPVRKDCLLPFGRLRDLAERQDDADVIIVTKSPRQMDPNERVIYAHNMLGIDDYNPATFEGTSRTGHSQKIYFTYIKYGLCEGVYKSTDPHYIYAKKTILVTGIARDLPLRRYLSDMYKIIRRFNFPDHHKYIWSDINRIQASVRQNPTASVVTTEKDAQRLMDFNGMPQMLMERMFMVPIEMDFLSEEERKSFKDFITGL
jgi:tetraacyldisaccharide 4'-kinase